VFIKTFIARDKNGGDGLVMAMIKGQAFHSNRIGAMAARWAFLPRQRHCVCLKPF
jgi:hypothetical protein